MHGLGEYLPSWIVTRCDSILGWKGLRPDLGSGLLSSGRGETGWSAGAVRSRLLQDQRAVWWGKQRQSCYNSITGREEMPWLDQNATQLDWPADVT
ncbi:unnamed protein product [Caretta caretta]